MEQLYFHFRSQQEYTTPTADPCFEILLRALQQTFNIPWLQVSGAREEETGSENRQAGFRGSSHRSSLTASLLLCSLHAEALCPRDTRCVSGQRDPSETAFLQQILASGKQVGVLSGQNKRRRAPI